MNEIFTFVGHQITIHIEHEHGRLFAKTTCPICGGTEDSDDHGFGAKHASIITKGKIQTHMRLQHGIKEPEENKGDERMA